MLVVGIVPGPREPSDLDSFLSPLVAEMLSLKEGIPAVDGSYNEPFTLRAHIVLVSGDTPAISKMMKMTGHNGRQPCRFCKIEGVWSESSRHYYFPHTNFTMHRRENMRREILRVITSGNLNLRTATGISGLPILLQLDHSIDFPKSFGQDPMHLLTNVAKFMWMLWSGLGKHIDTGNAEPYELSESTLMAIGEEMEVCRSFLPSALCQTPRNIHKYWRSFKAKEWEAFILYFSLPLLNGRLPSYAIQHWALFVDGVRLLYRRRLDDSEILAMQKYFERWLVGFKAIYYRDQELSHCRSQNHAVLHLADSIKWLGPAFVFWQYPLERLVGTLERLSSSKRHLNQSLFNSVSRYEQLQYLLRVYSNFEEYSWTHESAMEEEPPDSSRKLDAFLTLLSPRTVERLSPTIYELLCEFLDYRPRTQKAEIWHRLRLRGKTIASTEGLQIRSDTRRNNLVEISAGTSIRYGRVMKFIYYEDAGFHGQPISIALLRMFQHSFVSRLGLPYIRGEAELWLVPVEDLVQMVGLVGSKRLYGVLNTAFDNRSKRWIVAADSDL